MHSFKKHLIHKDSELQEALKSINMLGEDGILFVVDDNYKLIGSLSDGDIRRALMSSGSLELSLEQIANNNPSIITSFSQSVEEIIKLRNSGVKIVPILDEKNIVVDVLNFKKKRNLLPVDAVIMAGGRGQRLRPLTDKVPKPLLNIGDKPIIKYSLDNLVKSGVKNYYFILRYLGSQIENYLKIEKNEDSEYSFIHESDALGTIGGASLIPSFENENILVTNSDILTDLDYEDFVLNFLKSNASMSVACIPYTVSIPYAVLEVENTRLKGFREKPTYTYYSSAGIYMIKRHILEKMEYNGYRDMTDLMDELINAGHQINTYHLNSVWIDIGSHEDYKKAQKHIEKK